MNQLEHGVAGKRDLLEPLTGYPAPGARFSPPLRQNPAGSFDLAPRFGLGCTGDVVPPLRPTDPQPNAHRL